MSDGAAWGSRKKALDARKEALAKLKDATRRGVKISYDPNAGQEDIFEEIDEEEYQRRKKKENMKNFVVDQDFSSEESAEEFPGPSEPAKKKCRSSNMNVRRQKNVSRGSDIMNMFKKAKPKDDISKLKDYKPEEDELLQDILRIAAESSKKKKKNNNNNNNKRPPVTEAKVQPPLSSFKSSVPVASQPKVEAKTLLINQKSESQVALKREDSFFNDEDSLLRDLIDGNLLGEDGTLKIGATNFESIAQPPADSRAERGSEKSIAGSDVRKDKSVVNLEQSNVESVDALPQLVPLDIGTEPSADQSRAVFTIDDFVTVDAEGDSHLQFYYFDAYEDPTKHPGVVFFFGKAYSVASKSWINCALTVPKVLRRYWLRPAIVDGKAVDAEQIYHEIKKVMDDMRVDEFAVKVVQKKFWKKTKNATDEPIDYLELRYGFDERPLDPTIKGKTFSAVYGGSSSALEILILSQNVKGPRMFDVLNPVMSSSRKTYCNIEIEAQPSSVKSGHPEELPRLTVMVMKFVSLFNRSSKENEVLIVSLMIGNVKVDDKSPTSGEWQRVCVVSKGSHVLFPYGFKDFLKNQKFTNVTIVANERALINFILAKVRMVNPDIILGHDLIDFELFNFFKQVYNYKMHSSCRLSRLRSMSSARLIHTKGMLRSLTAGRLVFDLKILAKEFVRAKDYTLPDLALVVLNEKYNEIPLDEVKSHFSDSESLYKLIITTMTETFLSWHIVYKLCLVSMTAEISRVVGGIWSKTLFGGRAERTEFLLLHAFYGSGFIYPEKKIHHSKNALDLDENVDGEATSSDKKSSYTGGLVLEPKKGFYDTFVLLLDFNSLYPSIIQEYNICFTTVDTSSIRGAESNVNLTNIACEANALGVLPAEIKRIVESRKQLKRMMNSTSNEDQRKQYNIRQQALKITANSVYGCLGFSISRFYDKSLAALITFKGREILVETKELVDRLGFDVIYGDTDSILINTQCGNVNEVIATGKKIVAEVNKRYRLLELDIDGVYKKLLLLKKKKYAALALEDTGNGWTTRREVKGLDIVRRDWSNVAVQAGEFVLNAILGDKSADEAVDSIFSHLTNLSTKIRQGSLPIDVYIIHKQLTKNPSEYVDSKAQSHVLVALRMNKAGHHFQRGDVVNYVICQDNSGRPATQRAYHPTEVPKEALQIDQHYYLSQQILPVIGRLCESINGIGMAQLAKSMGLDDAAYKIRLKTNVESVKGDVIYVCLSDGPEVEQFKITCSDPTCGAEINLTNVFICQGDSVRVSLASCSNAKCKVEPKKQVAWIKNELRLSIRRAVKKYYQNWLLCDDSSCGYKTRRLPMRLSDSGKPICPKCNVGTLDFQYSAKSLYQQIAYYKRCFDICHAHLNLSRQSRHLGNPYFYKYEKFYKFLKAVADHFDHLSSYAYVDLKQVFQFVNLKR